MRGSRGKQPISADDNDHNEVSYKVAPSRKVKYPKLREVTVPVSKYLESSKKRKRRVEITK